MKMTTDETPPIKETGVPKSLPHLAYDAYAVSTGGKTFDGRDMPGWEELPERIQAAWTAAAHRVSQSLWTHAEPLVTEIELASNRMTGAALVRHQDVVVAGAVLIGEHCAALEELLGLQSTG
jgi:hypothetical protein